ncbi:electron transfer flavoprotein subunit beta/FixA family protein [Anaerotignum sp.]|nr:electron transfer flavoprotein subunit beta/FixA family protein [Anaerotignum sp.]MBQ7759229.1 electron transfer flavoprotein subunit beta/FixA family protein [Anaerotignum sp.]
MRMLRMAVCMKQVPGDIGKSLSADGRIRRDAPSSIINPADVFSLETALTLKEQHTGQVDIFTMGTEAARSLLKEAATLGADGLFLVSDRDFAGADTYATAFVLAAALRKTAAYDLIFCGRRTLDGETGQVSIQIAEMLGIPVVTNVIQLELTREKVICRRLLEDGEETVEAAIPALISVMEGIEGIDHPRLPSIFGLRNGGCRAIITLNREILGLAKEQVGSGGSFTEVNRSFFPEWKRNCALCEIEEGVAVVQAKLKQIKEGSGPK